MFQEVVNAIACKAFPHQNFIKESVIDEGGSNCIILSWNISGVVKQQITMAGRKDGFVHLKRLALRMDFHVRPRMYMKTRHMRKWVQFKPERSSLLYKGVRKRGHLGVVKAVQPHSFRALFRYSQTNPVLL